MNVMNEKSGLNAFKIEQCKKYEHIIFYFFGSRSAFQFEVLK